MQSDATALKNYINTIEILKITSTHRLALKSVHQHDSHSTCLEHPQRNIFRVFMCRYMYQELIKDYCVPF